MKNSFYSYKPTKKMHSFFFFPWQDQTLMQGCRALLVDKDKNPKVKHNSFLQDIIQQVVLCCFTCIFIYFCFSGSLQNSSLWVIEWLTITLKDWRLKIGKISNSQLGQTYLHMQFLSSKLSLRGKLGSSFMVCY